LALSMANSDSSSSSTVQIVVATHGDLACALVRTVELIAGPQSNILCLGLLPGDDLQLFKSRLRATVTVEKPALILVDMPGGTPWNLALVAAAEKASVRVVAGVNLPMLLEVVLAPYGEDIDQLARLAQETAVQAVRIGSTGDR
jgi:mannose/fructose/sorbose-specific phosphotransferase system IIA component